MRKINPSRIIKEPEYQNKKVEMAISIDTKLDRLVSINSILQEIRDDIKKIEKKLNGEYKNKTYDIM